MAESEQKDTFNLPAATREHAGGRAPGLTSVVELAARKGRRFQALGELTVAGSGPSRNAFSFRPFGRNLQSADGYQAERT